MARCQFVDNSESEEARQQPRSSRFITGYTPVLYFFSAIWIMKMITAYKANVVGGWPSPQFSARDSNGVRISRDN
jgi:hypothetical protein